VSPLDPLISFSLRLTLRRSCLRRTSWFLRLRPLLRQEALGGHGVPAQAVRPHVVHMLGCELNLPL
jgi:hypothetical protein